MQLLHRGAADAAPRSVQDTLEGKVVRGLVDEAQIGKRVSDFLSFVKPRPADHAIRDGERDEPLLELAGLKTRADKDRDLAERMLLSVQYFDFITDPAGFLLGVPHGPHEDFFALVCFGPQGLAEPAAILRDHAAGGTENVRRRTVIL